MKLKNASPFDLTPNPWNSNRVERDNFEKLKKSLTSLGSFKPVVVRQSEGKLEILAGYHRVEAAKELGWTEIPIIDLGELSNQKAKEISIVDNTRYGQDDEELLESLVNSMDTELIQDILPELAEVDIPDMSDDLGSFEEEKPLSRDEDESAKTLRFKYFDLDKADEIEDLLLIVARDNGYYFADGYANLSDALYHALIMDKK